MAKRTKKQVISEINAMVGECLDRRFRFNIWGEDLRKHGDMCELPPSLLWLDKIDYKIVPLNFYKTFAEYYPLNDDLSVNHSTSSFPVKYNKMPLDYLERIASLVKEVFDENKAKVFESKMQIYNVVIETLYEEDGEVSVSAYPCFSLEIAKRVKDNLVAMEIRENIDIDEETCTITDEERCFEVREKYMGIYAKVNIYQQSLIDTNLHADYATFR